MKKMDLANYLIFVAHDEAQGLSALDGVISNLGEEHQDKLKEVHKLVRDGSMVNGPRVDAREVFQQISAYLNKTHYCEYNIGTVPVSTLKSVEDAPNEKINARVKAKI
jgi:hypothetical protein